MARFGCLLVYTSEVNLPVKKQWKCIGILSHHDNTCMCALKCVLCVFVQRFVFGSGDGG